MVSPLTFNGLLAAGHGTVACYQFMLLPVILLPSDDRWLLTLIPLAALHNPLWS